MNFLFSRPTTDLNLSNTRNVRLFNKVNNIHHNTAHKAHYRLYKNIYYSYIHKS